MSKTPQPKTSDRLTTLPPELRNRIHELSLPWGRIIRVNKPNRHRTGIIGVSRQIRQEALPMLWSKNSFVYHLDVVDRNAIEAMCGWLRSVISSCGLDLSPNLKIKVAHVNVELHLVAFLPLLNLIRETGLELAASEDVVRYDKGTSSRKLRALYYVAGSSIFIMQHREAQSATQKILEKAVGLGRQSRTENWSQEELEKKYGELIEPQSPTPFYRALSRLTEKQKRRNKGRA